MKQQVVFRLCYCENLFHNKAKKCPDCGWVVGSKPPKNYKTKSPLIIDNSKIMARENPKIKVKN